MNIGVFDSGIGGLTVLEELIRELPHCNFFFYGDNKNNPYGDKSDEELIRITSGVVEELNKKGCRMIVIACGTATTRCMDRLQEMNPDNIFIGTLPAVKTACEKNYRNIMVMATTATITSAKLKEIIDENIREGQNIYPVACPGLADAIEANDEKAIDRILNRIRREYRDKNIDAIVLGCTHYPFIRDEIQKKFPKAVLMDSARGVARAVSRQLRENGLIVDEKEKGTLEVTFTRKKAA